MLTMASLAEPDQKRDLYGPASAINVFGRTFMADDMADDVAVAPSRT